MTIALDKITEAPANCPRLCDTAPHTQKRYPLTGRGSCSKSQNTNKESPPPQAERNPAVAPRVRKANSAFNMTNEKAVRVFKNKMAYMTTMLDNPSFKAGISPKRGVT